MDTLVFTLNAVFPIFILLIVGVLLGKTGLFKDDFYSGLEKLAFKVTLPVMLFREIVNCDIGGTINVKFTALLVLGICVGFLLPCLWVPLAVKDNGKRSAFIQGAYRSNIAIIGIPVMKSMYGEEGGAVMASIMPFAIILFNVFAVIILSVYAPSDKKQTKKEIFITILKNIITNPLIIGIVAAVPFMLLSVDFPTFMDKSLAYIADMTLPLAMIALGAGFKKESLKGRAAYAAFASFVKLVALPALMISAFILLGYRRAELGVIVAVFGGPTAAASYVMAKNMGSDHFLAGQILIITTSLSTLTLFAVIFLLRSLGFL